MSQSEIRLVVDADDSGMTAAIGSLRPRPPCLFPFALLLVVGCITSNTNILPNATYHPASAYLYGRFVNDGKAVSVVFVVRCRDGKTYNIDLSGNHIQLIQIAPTKCQLDDIVYGAGQELHSRMPSFRMLENEVLVAGGLYYVGDFYAESTRTPHNAQGKVRVNYRITPVNNYAETTRQMKASFPGMASVPTENRLNREARITRPPPMVPEKAALAEQPTPNSP